MNFSFRATNKLGSKSLGRDLLFCGQRALLTKMGKSHSRPETLPVTNKNSNLISSKDHSASKNSVVSETGVHLKRKISNTRLASNTSQQTVKEAGVVASESTTQAITNNAKVNTSETQSTNDHPHALQNSTPITNQAGHRKKSSDENNSNQSPNLFKKVMRKVSGKRTKSKEKLQHTSSNTSTSQKHNNSTNNLKNKSIMNSNRLSSKESNNSCHSKSTNSVNSQSLHSNAKDSNLQLSAIAKTPSALSSTGQQPTPMTGSISYLSDTENTASLHEKQSFAAISLNTDNASIMTLQSGKIKESSTTVGIIFLFVRFQF